MSDPFNRFAGTTFARTQAASLRNVPWADAPVSGSTILRVVGKVVMWACLLTLWFALCGLALGLTR